MQQRELGDQGLQCGAVGLGCMGMSHVYGPADEAESLRTIARGLDLGMSLLDTADVYGLGGNEKLVGQAVAERRDDAVIATKFGMKRRPDGSLVGVDGSPEYVVEACEASLRRLGVETIDLYYAHRLDPQVPVEDTVGAMGRLVEQGKVRFLGLSEASPENLRRAHAVHPISALQSEYSLWTREVEQETLPLLRELGIGFVAYSPLGRGMLTGTIASQNDLAERDYRRSFPRYEEGNIERNAALVARLRTIADDSGATLAQLCIGWLLSRSEQLVPIAGTKRTRYVSENADAAAISLTTDQLAAIDSAFDAGEVIGERFRPAAMERLAQSSPNKE